MQHVQIQRWIGGGGRSGGTNYKVFFTSEYKTVHYMDWSLLEKEILAICSGYYGHE